MGLERRCGGAVGDGDDRARVGHQVDRGVRSSSVVWTTARQSARTATARWRALRASVVEALGEGRSRDGALEPPPEQRLVLAAGDPLAELIGERELPGIEQLLQ